MKSAEVLRLICKTKAESAKIDASKGQMDLSMKQEEMKLKQHGDST